jgi:hypothetical protein
MLGCKDKAGAFEEGVGEDDELSHEGGESELFWLCPERGDGGRALFGREHAMMERTGEGMHSAVPVGTVPLCIHDSQR